MRSRPLPPRKPRAHGIGSRERNRRLLALGLSRHDDDVLQAEALAIVERFRQWTNRQPCVVTGWRSGERREFEGRWYLIGVEWAHVVRTRGAFAEDFGCAVPLVDLLHRQQEGNPRFFAVRGMNAAGLAEAHAVKFFAEHPDDARWIVEHAADGDAVALARKALELP